MATIEELLAAEEALRLQQGIQPTGTPAPQLQQPNVPLPGVEQPLTPEIQQTILPDIAPVADLGSQPQTANPQKELVISPEEVEPIDVGLRGDESAFPGLGGPLGEIAEPVLGQVRSGLTQKSDAAEEKARAEEEAGVARAQALTEKAGRDIADLEQSQIETEKAAVTAKATRDRIDADLMEMVIKKLLILGQISLQDKKLLD